MRHEIILLIKVGLTINIYSKTLITLNSIKSKIFKGKYRRRDMI